MRNEPLIESLFNAAISLETFADWFERIQQMDTSDLPTERRQQLDAILDVVDLAEVENVTDMLNELGEQLDGEE